MLKRSYYFLFFLGMLSTSHGYENGNNELPCIVGLSLGHKYLQSAYHDHLGVLHVIAEIPSSQEWQDYFINTMEDGRNHAPYDDPSNLALSEATISSIVDASFDVLSTLVSTPSIQIRSIVVPQHFDDISSIVNIMRIARNKGYIERSNQVITKFNGARLAYNLDRCTGYGFPEDCDVDAEEHFVFIIDLGSTYLSLGMVIAGYIMYAPVKTKHWTHFMPMDETDSYDPVASLPPFTSSMLEDFFIQALGEFENDFPDVTTQLVAIILTGEAAPAQSQEVIDIIHKSFSAFSKSFKITKNPVYVGVEGAVHRAKQAVTEPFWLEPLPPGDHEYLEHVEDEDMMSPHEEL